MAASHGGHHVLPAQRIDPDDQVRKRSGLDQRVKPATRRPLANCRILDFSSRVPGPLATQILAEAGAEAIKIERPDGGDNLRARTPRWGDTSLSFALLNTGKRSIAIDLKSEADRGRLLPLVREADIVVEQFRPGVMARLGLGYEVLKKINPKLIYCSITGTVRMAPAHRLQVTTSPTWQRPDCFRRRKVPTAPRPFRRCWWLTSGVDRCPL